MVRGEREKETEEARKRKWNTDRAGLFTQTTLLSRLEKREAATNEELHFFFSPERT